MNPSDPVPPAEPKDRKGSGGGSFRAGERPEAGKPGGGDPVDRALALERLMDLLSISAPTGEEGPLRDHLIAELLKIGVPRSAIRVDDSPLRITLPCQTGNLIASIPGNAPGPRRLFIAHMDTVPLAKNAEPVLQGDRITALGETALGGDDRAGVAVVLTAIDELKKRRIPHPPLVALFTIREESGLRGAAAVRPEDLGGPSGAFNFDGGSPEEITIGATGSVRLEIEVLGHAAHAGLHPERGVSAVAVFAAAVSDLEKGGWLGLIRKPEGSGTSNIGMVRGGDATNVVTDRLEAVAEVRSHDPTFLSRIVEEFRRIFAAAAQGRRTASGQSGDVKIQAHESYASFKLPEDEPVVQEALAAARRAGLKPRTRISNGGLDANWLVRKSIPTVSIGCGAHENHTTDEYVSIEEFIAACRFSLELARARTPCDHPG